MKKLLWALTLTLAISLATSAHAYGSKKEKDIQEIETLVQKLVTAYNQRDEALMQKIWAEDGDLVSTPGAQISTGKEKVIAEIKQDQNTEYKNSQLNVTVTNIKFIGKNAAVVEAKNLLSGIITPGGTKLPPLAHYMIIIVEKQKKEWLIDGVRYFSSLPLLRQRT